jgi:hypothetical protein
MRFVPALAASCAAMLLSIAARSQPVQFPLAGIVVNSITGAPVPGARVWLHRGFETESDAAGGFHFANVPAGEYILSAEKAGFDQDEAEEIELSGARTALLIRLAPLATIRGRITDDDGDPVDGVTVVALRAEVESGWRRYTVARQAITDDRGQYRIPWLPKGNYLVQAAGRDEHAFAGEVEAASRRHEAFAPVYFGGAKDRASATVVRLHPGDEPRADISIAITTGNLIKGRITNLKPQTQPSIQLLAGEDSLGLNRSTIHFATGDFVLHDVINGIYKLRVIGVGADNQPLVGEKEIQVAGADVDGVELTLAPGANLQGTVRVEGDDFEAKSEAWSQFAVKLSAPENIRALGLEAFYSNAVENGTFVVPRILPGRYTVSFSGPPFYVASARAGQTDLLDKPEIRIGDSPPPELEVVLRADAGAIEGSTPQVDETIILAVPESPNHPPAITFGGEGSFEIAGVAPGWYRLHAWTELDQVGPIPYKEPEILRLLAATGTRVQVRPGEKTTVRIEKLSEIPQ